MKDLFHFQKEDKNKLAINSMLCVGFIIFATFLVTIVAVALFAKNFELAWKGLNAGKICGLIFTNLFLFSSLFILLILFDKKHIKSAKEFFLIVFVILLTYTISCICLKYANQYAMPIIFCGLMIGVLISSKSAVLSVVLAAFMILVNSTFNGISDIGISSIVSGLICNTISAFLIVYWISKHYTRLKFIVYSLTTTVISFSFVIVMSIANKIFDINLFFNVLWVIVGNVGSVFLFMPFLPIFETIFNIADDFRLDEICNLSHPLLKRLASEAPGTFNHSLVVANLAERCAIAIGENPKLAKASGYYHDVGKLKAPTYFSENQTNYNPHDELIPEVSVGMITSHALFGEMLTKKHHLPAEIVKIAKEHHGTSPVSYFYQKALKLTENPLTINNYKYKGPKPTTKISAIIMIVDTAEAAFRSYIPETKSEFVKKLDEYVDEKLKDGQFDDCPITMKDLNVIKQTIVDVLPSIHHNRVNYDLVKKKPVEKDIKDEKVSKND